VSDEAEAGRRTFRPRLLLGLVVLAVVVGLGSALLVRPSGSTSNASASVVDQFTKAVPESVADIPLVDEQGRPTDLAAFRRRVVVLADFLSSCQEVCPITTGVLLDVQQTLARDHLLNKVEIAEVSVDPWRDTPGRLLAYSKMTGTPWTLLTGSAANLQRLWSYFGALYYKVAEGTPPNLDWQTGKPYTFDIDHSDDVFFRAPSGVQRAVIQGMPSMNGALPKSLSGLLDAQGKQNLAHPGFGSWNAADVVAEARRLTNSY
jgi:protein SCO1/2